MLRYRMALMTLDPALKRAVKRLTTATGSHVEFIGESDTLEDDPPNLTICDLRRDPKRATDRLPKQGKIIHLIPGDRLAESIRLLCEPRTTSLFCLDERFDDDEFIATTTKALRGELFGLQKYFPWGVTTFTMQVQNYKEKTKAIEVLLAYATLGGCRGAVRDRIQLVCDELMMNALYHAPVDSKGRERYVGKSLKELAQLPEVSPIEVRYGSSGRYFGVAVRDLAGSLTRARLLEYLVRAGKKTQMENKASGAGLGLISVLQSVSKLVFNLEPGKSTEVIALFDMELFAKGKVGARSLHIFDDSQATAQPVLVARSGSRGLWVTAALLLAIAAALGGAYSIKRSGSAAAATAERAPTVTVFPDPADATVKIGGVAVSPGVPVRLEGPLAAPTTLLVEHARYRPRSIAIADTKDLRLYVALAPEQK
jgi:hypothetical protein